MVRPMRFAYADPPYLGRAGELYGRYHRDAAAWDEPAAHIGLLERLQADYPDGWLVCLNVASLPLYLAHAPDARVGAWVKPWIQYRPTNVQHAWEPVVWAGGRKIPDRRPSPRDYLICDANNPATTTAGLAGRKPPAFNRWVLDLLGYQDGDTLDDLFPGSGGMAREIAAGVLL